MGNEKEKTSPAYWDKLYEKKKAAKEGIIQQVIENPLHRRLQSLFKSYLPKGKNKFLEIGCAPGRWLIYFHREFGYEVYGIDYSEPGCALTIKTLQANGIEGQIICQDFLDASFREKYREFFDVVYSLGVIEHFEDPQSVIATHLELLKEGGFLIIAVPNYGDGTISRKWVRLVGKEQELLRTHNVEIMKVSILRKKLEELNNNVEIQLLDYVGPIHLQSVVKYIGAAFNRVIGYLTFYLRSESLSPEIVLIAKKSRAPL